jgi:large subunit ribosomal protein L28
MSLKEVDFMSNKCAVCGKGKATGMQVSHSHIRTKKTWAPNLQNVKAMIDGTPKKVKVCTRCLRSGKVERAN